MYTNKSTVSFCEYSRFEMILSLTYPTLGSKIGLISYGTVHTAIEETIDILKKQKVEIDYLRIRALPLSPKVNEFIDSHEEIFIVEQNRDAQMFNLIKEELDSLNIKKIKSCAYSDGMPMSASKISANIIEKTQIKINKKA